MKFVAAMHTSKRIKSGSISKNIESWTIGAILSHGTSVNYATSPPILSHGTSVNYATGSLKSPKKARISCSSIQTQRARRKIALFELSAEE